MSVMALSSSETTGFLSKNAFDKGCKALRQLNLRTSQTTLMMEIRNEVNIRCFL